MQGNSYNSNLSSWSIRNPVPTMVLFLVFTVMGLFAFSSIGIDENPNIDVPVVSVIVTQMGAAPSELETQVTRRIEDSIAGLGNIKHITSTVTDGASSTGIEFILGTNTDRAVNDVRDAVTKIRQQLPQGIDEPIIQRVDFVGGPFVTYSVSSPKRTVGELSWLVDNDISRVLLSVPGVGQVQRSGGVDREVRINLDPTRLEAVGVTADMVNSQIRALNVDLPGGRGEIGAKEQSIRTLGSAPSVAQLAGTQIALPNGNYARLDTLGTVTDGTSEQRQMALLNGKPIVALSVVRSMGSNLVDVENGVDTQLQKLKKILPSDVTIEKIRTNGKYIRESYAASLESLIIGAVLAVIVVWIFLKDWRATGISSLAIPLSIIPTFAIMQWCNFTLNNMSLLGLALVIGILVDDAIVEIENIVRHITMGKKPYQASMDAADEIALAVVATTMTVIVVFVPVAFMGGIPGQFFKQFGLTVAVAVLFSLLVARMLTPMMAAYLMKEIKEEHKESKMLNIYNHMLKWALSHRILSVATGIVLFVVSIGMFRMMPTALVANVDREETLLTAELPPGSTIYDSERAIEAATNILGKHKEVVRVFATIGAPTSARRSQAGSQGEVNKANLYIVLTPRHDRKLTQQQFEDKVRKELDSIPGVRLGFARSIKASGKPLSIALTSDDPKELDRAAETLLVQARDIKGLYDVTSSASLLRPEIIVEPDFARAAEQGVSVYSIARTALIATLGDTEANLAKFNLTDRQINVRVEIDPSYRHDIQVIGNLQVAGAGGKMVPLRSVASIKFGSGPFEITRFDRQRQITLDAGIETSMTLGQALEAIHKLPAYKSLPSSIKETPLGDAEIQRDVFSGFASAISFAILLIYAVLVLLFGNFFHPFTIMVSLPLSLCGALIALVVFGQPLGMYALIGIVMLMGLVTKNAILLVEYCIMSMKNGMEQREAIMAAGATRMRPILMTTVAMIAGMLPIALGFGAGSEARAPMGLAVIGGLITSTLLTLVLVPVVFTYVDDVQHWFARFLPKADESSLTDAQSSDKADQHAGTRH